MLRTRFFSCSGGASRKRKALNPAVFSPHTPCYSPISGSGPHLHFSSCPGAALTLNMKPPRPCADIPYKKTKSGKTWLKSAPVTGTHNSKLREDNVHMLEPDSPGKSLCPSLREVKKGEGVGGGLLAPPLLVGLCRKRHSSVEGEAAQRHGCMARS